MGCLCFGLALFELLLRRRLFFKVVFQKIILNLTSELNN